MSEEHGKKQESSLGEKGVDERENMESLPKSATTENGSRRL